MDSSFKGHHAGWTGIRTSMDVPRSVERKRKGRNVDVIGSSLPTPPHRRHNVLPTPETERRPSKSFKLAQSTDAAAASSSHAHPPTPQTQRHRRRVAPASGSQSPSSESVSPPSPSGHTTFFLSSTTTTSSRPEGARRRPGLMFAQQMGLLSVAAGGGGPRGVGVGMGGQKSAHVKVDQIQVASKADDNPFLVVSEDVEGDIGVPAGLASPGAITIQQPCAAVDSDEEQGQPLSSPVPRRSPRLASTSPRHSPSLASPSASKSLTRPTLSTTDITGLLSPPPTKQAPRIGVLSSGSSSKAITRAEQAERARSRHQAEEHLRMLDEEHNPFLVKPGEPSSRRPGPIVDENQPTVTYIFRGAKKVFANPLYSSKAPFPEADLRPEDDEFEPHPLPKPKLLWPEGPSPSKRVKLQGGKRSKPGLPRTPSPAGAEELSPPWSPVAATPVGPTIKASRRFGGTALAGESVDRLARDEGGAFTDEDEGEGGEVVGMGHDEDAEGEAEAEEMALPVRRGLLFGGSGLGGLGGLGMKRGLNTGDERQAKKSKVSSRF